MAAYQLCARPQLQVFYKQPRGDQDQDQPQRFQKFNKTEIGMSELAQLFDLVSKMSKDRGLMPHFDADETGTKEARAARLKVVVSSLYQRMNSACKALLALPFDAETGASRAGACGGERAGGGGARGTRGFEQEEGARTITNPFVVVVHTRSRPPNAGGSWPSDSLARSVPG